MEFPPELETPIHPQVFAVNNSPIETIGQFEALILLDDDDSRTPLELPLHVMDCGDSQGILGRPFMTKHNMKLDLASSLVTITVNGEQITLSITESDPITRPELKMIGVLNIRPHLRLLNKRNASPKIPRRTNDIVAITAH